MATRNLAKTAIEGGRVKACRNEEHEITRSERHEIRQLLHRMTLDPESVDDVVAKTRRVYYGREFRDKLNPVRQWLESRCGRPWNKVYSEVKKTFDSRTTPGRHILYDHIVDSYVNTYRKEPEVRWYRVHNFDPATRQYVPTNEWASYTVRYYAFEIDRHGILRKTKSDK